MTGTGRQWDWSVAGWAPQGSDAKMSTNGMSERTAVLGKVNAAPSSHHPEESKN